MAYERDIWHFQKGEKEKNEVESPFRKLQILNKLIHYIQIFIYCIVATMIQKGGDSLSLSFESVMLGDVI